MSTKDKILSQLSANKQRSSNYIGYLHDALMAEYGWIPFEEFKKLPMQTAWNLLDAATIRHKRETKGLPTGRGH